MLATFSRVRVTAPNDGNFKTLLSNGNQFESGVVEDNADRVFAEYSDPFPKPGYLFALVAGSLETVSGTFTSALDSAKKPVLLWHIGCCFFER